MPHSPGPPESLWAPSLVTATSPGFAFFDEVQGVWYGLIVGDVLYTGAQAPPDSVPGHFGVEV